MADHLQINSASIIVCIALSILMLWICANTPIWLIWAPGLFLAGFIVHAIDSYQALKDGFEVESECRKTNAYYENRREQIRQNELLDEEIRMKRRQLEYELQSQRMKDTIAKLDEEIAAAKKQNEAKAQATVTSALASKLDDDEEPKEDTKPFTAGGAVSTEEC